MKKKVKVCIIVPCYNEEDNIIGVINELIDNVPDDQHWEIVAVNDCSTDDTLVKLHDDGRATVLELSCNMGIGTAVQTGLKYAVMNVFDYAVKFDGDGQHSGESVRNLLAPLMAHEADMVVGSRFFANGSGFRSTRLRRNGIRFFSWLISLFSDYAPSDPTSGLRGYNKQALAFMATHYPAFDYPEPEELLIMRRSGFRILDVKVEMRQRQGGCSSISFQRSIYYMLKVTVAIMMAALRK